MRAALVAGPNGLLSTLKHEFGHGYLNAGDGYVSDFIATDDDGNPLYGQDYWESYSTSRPVLIQVLFQNALKQMGSSNFRHIKCTQ